MDERGENRVDTLIDAAIRGRVFPGIVCGVWERGRKIFGRVAGWAAPPEDEWTESMPLSADTRFDLASLTKPLSTAMLVMQAEEAGELALDDPLSRFLPGLHPATGEVTIRALLTHTAGMPPVPFLQKRFADPFHVDRARAIGHLCAIAPDRPPGGGVVYSCTGFLFLGLVLERLSGLPVGELFARSIAAPLGLVRTGFAPLDPGSQPCAPPGAIPGSAPTEFCPWRNERIQGRVHDESSWCLGGHAGNAGLFSCLDETARIASTFLEEGSPGGCRILAPGSVALMTSLQTPGLDARRALGFLMHGPETADGPRWPDRAFGHTGFTGTSVFMEPERKLLAVALTNRVYYGRESTAEAIMAFRREFHTAIIEA